jgi:hypothetical protein
MVTVSRARGGTRARATTCAVESCLERFEKFEFSISRLSVDATERALDVDTDADRCDADAGER